MVALLEKENAAQDLEVVDEPEREHEAERAGLGNNNAEASDEPSEAESGAAEEAAVPEVDAPEFWSAEDKEFWKQVPVEIRPVLKKYEQNRIEFANQKAQEAAKAREEAQRSAAEQIKQHNETNAKY